MVGLVGLKGDRRIGFAVEIQLWPRQFKNLGEACQDGWVGKACPVAKPDNLSSIPSTHMIEGENGQEKPLCNKWELHLSTKKPMAKKLRQD